MGHKGPRVVIPQVELSEEEMSARVVGMRHEKFFEGPLNFLPVFGLNEMFHISGLRWSDREQALTYAAATGCDVSNCSATGCDVSNCSGCDSNLVIPL